MILRALQSPKPLAEPKVPDQVKRRQIIPLTHIRRAPSFREPRQPRHQFIDVPCDNALLRLQAPGRERMRERLSEPSMVRVVGSDDVLAAGDED